MLDQCPLYRTARHRGHTFELQFPDAALGLRRLLETNRATGAGFSFACAAATNPESLYGWVAATSMPDEKTKKARRLRPLRWHHLPGRP
ncbi:MAG TPA: hypothetical protein DIW77_22820 [Chromatiaceae bacterium]|nr:MAG: hypothetical protein N838_07730 [Thiohalocapsa sp. PB-PSB1]HCS92789.1 hypothetical protein [Chromatiaceae bacterium]